MTNDEIQRFVTAVNAALPASMELCLEVVDRRAGVVHMRLDRREGVPSMLQLSFATVRVLATQGGQAGAAYLRKMYAE